MEGGVSGGCADPYADGIERDPYRVAKSHLVGCARGGIGTCLSRQWYYCCLCCCIIEVVSQDVTVARDPLNEEVD